MPLLYRSVVFTFDLETVAYLQVALDEGGTERAQSVRHLHFSSDERVNRSLCLQLLDVIHRLPRLALTSASWPSNFGAAHAAPVVARPTALALILHGPTLGPPTDEHPTPAARLESRFDLSSLTKLKFDAYGDYPWPKYLIWTGLPDLVDLRFENLGLSDLPLISTIPRTVGGQLQILHLFTDAHTDASYENIDLPLLCPALTHLGLNFSPESSLSDSWSALHLASLLVAQPCGVEADLGYIDDSFEAFLISVIVLIKPLAVVLPNPTRLFGTSLTLVR